MSPIELFEIIVGLIVLFLLVTSPAIIILVIPYIKSAIYKLVDRLTNGLREYDSNGDYIPRNR
jgi:hypothetical protein